ncbi:hypothetical protein BCR34DRAFT_667651, partial [Clohesyomyces aquaticus]
MTMNSIMFNFNGQLLSVILLHARLLLGQTPGNGSTTNAPTQMTPPSTHAPIPTVQFAPLPPEYSDIRQAVSCWDSQASYQATTAFLWNQYISNMFYSPYNVPSTSIQASTYVYTYSSCTTAYPGLTTLCDGYPRASDCIESCVTTSSSTETTTYTAITSGEWLRPTWSTEIDQAPSPTCRVAANLSPECKRLEEAYSWRVSQFDKETLASATVNSTTSPSAYNSPLPPNCRVLIPPNPSAKLKCWLEFKSYDAYFWPTPTPTPTDPNRFCSRNATVPIATPNIPGKPNTAVISQLTMTSPFVYHILHNVTMYTFRGQASSIGERTRYPGHDVYEPTSSFDIIHYSQPQESILSQTKECHRLTTHGIPHCNLTSNPDFSIQDLFSVDANHYYPYSKDPVLATPTLSTICQASYKPRIALVVSEVAKQNGIEVDCEWSYAHNDFVTTTQDPASLSVWQYGGEVWHPITSSGQDVPRTLEGSSIQNPNVPFPQPRRRSHIDPTTLAPVQWRAHTRSKNKSPNLEPLGHLLSSSPATADRNSKHDFLTQSYKLGYIL